MELSNWTQKMRKKFPGMIEKFMGGKSGAPDKTRENMDVMPSVNISDSNHNNFELQVAVPGLTKKDVDIEVENNCLIITSDVEEPRDVNWIRKEFNYASFHRVFELPENANPENIKASLDNGILKITIAKKKGVKQNFKKISVK